MKTLTLTVENAIVYHEPDPRPTAQILTAASESYPVPVPTETSIPEVTSTDIVLFQVKNSEGKVLLQLAISNYFHLVGVMDGDKKVIDEWRNVRDRPARESPLGQPGFAPRPITH